MNSRFIIERPIFASVISIVFILMGALAMVNLPIAQYPDLLPPTVQVTTSYYGASPEVIAETVAGPLEEAINGVDGMIYMSSVSSSNGQLAITVTFDIGTDPQTALTNVNNRVQTTLSQLPSEVQQMGVTVEKRSASMLFIIAITSPDNRFDPTYLSNYAQINIIDDLKRVPGVGEAQNFASMDYAMRIWLLPDRMAQAKVGVTDIATAIQEQNAQFAPGSLGEQPMASDVEMTYTINAKGRLTTPEEFGDIIIRALPDGSTLRLKDVARVELGARTYSFQGKLNNQAAIPIGIFLNPGANALETADLVKARMEELSKSFPEGVAYSIPYDTTTFVRLSIEEVIKTLFEALVLVSLVVLIFLQNWRSTLIPCLCVPISIIGAFAGMYLFNFSINTLTLFGLVLAIGTVVDDSIVVVENVERVIAETGANALDATIQSMEEVNGPVIATVLVLCSVFVPTAFTGGLAGEMYRQFAITIAVAVVISGTVALTLTPALCALLLTKPHEKAKHGPYAWFNTFFSFATRTFEDSVKFFINRNILSLACYGLLIFLTWALFVRVPSSLAPEEDQGYIIASVMLPDGASLARTSKVNEEFSAFLEKNPDVEDAMIFSGFDVLNSSGKSYSGAGFISMIPWDKRPGEKNSSFELVKKVFAYGLTVPEAVILGFNPPPISGMSNTGGFEMYVQNRLGESPAQLSERTNALVAAANKNPALSGVATTFSSSVPQLQIELDRTRARAMSVPIDAIFDTLQATFGTKYVNDFNLFGKTYQVLLQADQSYRARPQDVHKIYVPSSEGNMIELPSLLNIVETTGPSVVERFNGFTAAKVVGAPASGYTSGQAIAAMTKVAAENLPTGYEIAWTGTAYQEQLTGSASAMVFVIGVLMVFLVLSALYENWGLPVAVLSTVPFALFGAFFATWICGLSNDVYLQVSLVTLIGLAAKNGVLIVEFAEQLFHQGLSIYDSAIAASRMRFRPIMMTSVTFILGVFPLAISTGAGAASRHSLGIGIIGGMIGATGLAPTLVPYFYRVFMKITRVKDHPSDPKLYNAIFTSLAKEDGDPINGPVGPDPGAVAKTEPDSGASGK